MNPIRDTKRYYHAQDLAHTRFTSPKLHHAAQKVLRHRYIQFLTTT